MMEEDDKGGTLLVSGEGCFNKTVLGAGFVQGEVRVEGKKAGVVVAEEIIGWVTLVPGEVVIPDDCLKRDGSA